ncbi:hypothetical protein J0H58_21030 [bacterium]|nr:hypothetical protein [bacterium]
MTEGEWEGCGDPAVMLRHLAGLVPDATMRLFLVGCCRRVVPLLRDPRSLDAVEVAEWFARAVATSAQLAAARVAAERAEGEATAAAQEAEELVFNAFDAEVWRELGATALASRAAAGSAAPLAEAVATDAACAAAEAAAAVADDDWALALSTEQVAQCDLLRTLVGWPVEPTTR